ncbi:hypothetical protein [Tropicibacter oceani]|uniref:Co-chaperone DjlA N-terminal domain-containing protein n=1 Tax=Tropicibacter oceani TaxID=3058420 RepID=A0ABY8QH15_9RHOB|nr:hypothetical protein [Tropicibacter oceani]WGW03276.1 hypothetical protein QF118_15285 [Tropicibacter oceani]
MPFIIAALGALAAFYFFVIRARNAQHMASEVLDAANDVRLAARRFGFRRQANVHPVETIEEPGIAIAALGNAFVELDDLPSKDQRDALVIALAKHGQMPSDEAQELTVLGRWLMNECGSPDQAVPRLARKLYKLQGADGFTPLLETVQAIVKAGSGTLSGKQKEALDDIRRIYRIK